MTTEQKQVEAGVTVSAVVVQSGRYEARIGADDGIVIHEVGPRGGKTHVISLNAAEAARLLELIAHGRVVLNGLTA